MRRHSISPGVISSRCLLIHWFTRIFPLAVGLLFFTLSACSGFLFRAPSIRADENLEKFQTPFRPPTVVLLATITPTLTLAPFRATPTAPCTNNLRFIQDITIPDGIAVEPNATLDKVWEVENNGTCNWDERYQLKYISGSKLNAQPAQPLFPARSKTKAQVRIIFQAPSEPGRYNSAWQAADPQGRLFGDPIFIDIVVKK